MEVIYGINKAFSITQHCYAVANIHVSQVQTLDHEQNISPT